MRTIVVYILRLLIDETEPGVLRGILKDVSSGEAHSFSSEQDLLELLISQPGRAAKTTDPSQLIQTHRSDV